MSKIELATSSRQIVLTEEEKMQFEDRYARGPVVSVPERSPDSALLQGMITRIRASAPARNGGLVHYEVILLQSLRRSSTPYWEDHMILET